MEYKRIDEHTIRCIITEEDMQDFGLDLDEFLTHSNKSDAFLRHIVEEAGNELGYQIGKGMVTMRLEVLSDGRISLTFGTGDEKHAMAHMMKHLKNIFPDVEPERLNALVDELAKLSDEDRARKINEMISNSLAQTLQNLGLGDHMPGTKRPQQPKQTQGDRQKEVQSSEKQEKEEIDTYHDTYRMYQFKSLQDVLAYCKAVYTKAPTRSHLYKDGEQYYIILDRYRISDVRYNRMTAIAFDYATVVVPAEDTYMRLREHGELLVENKAISTLRKI